MENELLYKKLENAVKKYEPGADKKLLSKVKTQCSYETIDCKGLRFKQLRDKLLLIGTILEEDEQNNTYVAVVNAGIKNGNPCIMVTNLAADQVAIYAFAREGLIKQQTAKKAIEILKKKLEFRVET